MTQESPEKSAPDVPTLTASAASAFSKVEQTSVPSGIRISLKSLGGLALFLALLAVSWALFISPTEYGTALEVGSRVAVAASKQAGMAPPYANVEIAPMRHTRGSILANDIAQSISAKKSSRSDDHMSGILANSHGPEVAMAIQRGMAGMQNDCTVQMSAQVFDHVGTPFSPMLMRMGSREDSFLILLSHEMAHCYWNPAPAYEVRMNAPNNSAVLTQQMINLMPLVINISESYADAYAMIFAARFDRKYYNRAYQALVAFRSAKGVPSDVYNTLGAVTAATEMASTLPSHDSPLSVRWDVTNRYVLSAALTGGMRWLMAQGLGQEEAIHRIAFVIQGQDIDFSLKNVNGKDYLIVSHAPEGFIPAAGMDANDPGAPNVSARSPIHGNTLENTPNAPSSALAFNPNEIQAPQVPFIQRATP